jgi:polar amino acid transport system substrate-binding protein
MRKFLPLLALLVVVAAAGCGGGDDESATTAAATETTASESLPLKQEGVLQVGAELPAPPFLIPPRDNPTGFEVDVIDEIAKRLGIPTVKWLNVPFTSLFTQAPTKFDLDINEITITEERDKVVDFSDSYFEANQALLVHKGTPAESAKTLADVQKLQLGAQAETTGLFYIKETLKPAKQARQYDTTTAANQALLNKQIDAFVIDVPIAAGLVQQSNDQLAIAGQFITNEHYGILFEEGNALRDRVNEVLQEMKDDGTLKRLQDKWFPGTTELPEIK